jgi:hypothetical protein
MPQVMLYPEGLMPGEPPYPNLMAVDTEEHYNAYYAAEMSTIHGWGPSLGMAAAGFVFGAGVVGFVAWQAGAGATKEPDEEATEDCPEGN